MKTTVFLTEMGDYDDDNRIYGNQLSEPYPTRSTVEVSDLPLDITVEIEVVATLP